MIEELEQQQQQQQQSGQGQGSLNPSSPAQDSNPLGGSGPGNVDRAITVRRTTGALPPQERDKKRHSKSAKNCPLIIVKSLKSTFENWLVTEARPVTGKNTSGGGKLRRADLEYNCNFGNNFGFFAEPQSEVTLIDGSQLAGEVTELSDDNLKFTSDGQTKALAIEQLQTINLSDANAEVPPNNKFAIQLHDGSTIHASNVLATATNAQEQQLQMN